MSRQSSGRTKDLHVWLKPEHHAALVERANENGQTVPAHLEQIIMRELNRPPPRQMQKAARRKNTGSLAYIKETTFGTEPGTIKRLRIGSKPA